ncbi:MAG: hypothetical protein Q8881_04115 [Sweet potato little leaf phytoplasma]|nr:hypothetical protein [Sweet potato little leaf phytoplasma]
MAESIPPNICQISHSARFRRNGRINPAEFRTQGRFRRNGQTSAKFRPR